MRDALRLLFEWGTERGKKADGAKLQEKANSLVTDLFKKGQSKNAKAKKADEIDLARRRATAYFMNILQLQESGYISEHFVQQMCKSVGTRILDILEPFEKALIEHIARRDKEEKDDVARKIEKLENDFAKLRAWSK